MDKRKNGYIILELLVGIPIVISVVVFLVSALNRAAMKKQTEDIQHLEIQKLVVIGNLLENYSLQSLIEQNIITIGKHDISDASSSNMKCKYIKFNNLYSFLSKKRIYVLYNTQSNAKELFSYLITYDIDHLKAHISDHISLVIIAQELTNYYLVPKRYLNQSVNNITKERKFIMKK